MDHRQVKNMEELAELSGVSRPTLSKYFQDPGSVRNSTREKIEAALKRYDYRPNIYAINQNRRHTRNVGIVVPYLADPFFTEISRVIELACIDAGYSPIVLSSHGRPAREKTNLESLRSLKPAGVLLAPIGRASDDAYIRSFAKDVPLVLFDAEIRGAGDAFIGTDHFQSTGLIVDYLCRSGEPPCLFEMRTPSNPNANKRRQAYLESMERNNCPAHVLQAEGEGWNFEEIGCNEGGRMLSEKAFPTGTVLCGNDRLAIGLLAAAYRLGIRVGRGEGSDLRVAGHDDHPFSRFTCPSLTTVAQEYAAIADLAANRLLTIVDPDRSESGRTTTLFEGKLVMRDSA